jgi:predicted metal-dependent phosphoesterase TrpH
MDARIDLHTHSDHSDGTLTPVQLVELAAQRAVQLLALTDHDTTAGCASAAAACAAHGIQFLPACELSSTWRGRELHIVGLRVAPHTPGLVAHLRTVQALRIARLQAIGERLRRCGLDGAALIDPVLARPGTPTRLHVARALVAAGVVADVEDAFKRYLGRGQRAAVPSEWPSPEACIEVITRAGGLAVLAHPHRYQLSAGGLRELCAVFREQGGAGIEVSLPGMGPADASQAASLARRYGLAGSLGSDFHEPGLPWRPLGRWLKLADGITPITQLLGFTPASTPQPA